MPRQQSELVADRRSVQREAEEQAAPKASLSAPLAPPPAADIPPAAVVAAPPVPPPAAIQPIARVAPPALTPTPALVPPAAPILAAAPNPAADAAAVAADPGAFIHLAIAQVHVVLPDIERTYLERFVRAFLPRLPIVRGIYVGSVFLFQDIIRLIETNPAETVPIVDTMFDFQDAVKAYTYLRSQKHVGKVVIRVN
ncbi:hypothetical protein BJ912DRAFT_920858 [Pholiota molesta]|nr:hypothetical protein BJ912DRAFT_920858 [Pholiota molesta]